MKEYFRVEGLTTRVSFVIGRGMILPHPSISYSLERHGSLLQRPAFPGNLFCVNEKPGKYVRHAEHGNWKGTQDAVSLLHTKKCN